VELNRDKYKGIIGTVIFHVAIILLLILLGFSTPLPLPGEEGVEVNLGVNEEGFGDVQPELPSESIAEYSPATTKTENLQEDIATQDKEETPIVVKPKEKPKEKAIVKDEAKEIVKEESKVNPDALYKGKSKQSTQQSGEGITGLDGDQGKPTGSADSKNYTGTGGTGDGLSFSLAGRTPKYLPKPSRNFKENGTIVVQIDVDKYGKVVKALAIDKGSNTTDATLRNLAEQAAKMAIFNANPDAADVQRGTITYHFVVKN
jgi:outer membrane biosynthesis protein TonB